MEAKSVRIKDIAQLAGVSVGTVDRVLHNRGKVSEDALSKVMTVLQQIDYKPNLIARTLGSNKTYKIATLLPEPSQDPYWAFCKSGIIQAQNDWMRYGVKIQTFHFDLYDKDSFKTVADSVKSSKPDGVLVAPIFHYESIPYFQQFIESNTPFVTINGNLPEVQPLTFIGQNLFQSGRVGAELLHMCTHCAGGTIVVLHLNEDLGNSIHLEEKEKGFRSYFADNNLTQYKIVTLNINNPSHSVDGEQIRAILKNEDVKGIFVTTSKGTYLMADFLESHCLKNIKLAGYDLLEQNINFLKKGVISYLIHQNPKRQALLGINHLVGNLVLKKHPPHEHLLPLEIISKENIDSYLHSEIH